MGGRAHDLEETALRAAEATSLLELGGHVLPPLQRAVGASSALLYRYDEAGRIETLAGDLSTVMQSYAHHYLHLDPVQVFPRRLAPQPRVVLATRQVDLRVHHRSPAYGEFYSTFGLEHLACTWLTHRPYATPGMTGILFTRTRRHEDFGADAERLIGRVLPVLTAATARAERLADLDRRRETLEAILAATSGPARLVFATNGQLLWASSAAERLLADAQVGAALRAAACRATAPTVSFLCDGAPREAHLSRLLTSSGAPLVLVEIAGGTAAPARGGELARRFELTAAEGAVLAQLAEGLANAEIAARLRVSVETVRTHVRRVLGKLGVRSRVEAALLVARR
jgi:DNA-binding CsgD family transcriptional regulator